MIGLCIITLLGISTRITVDHVELNEAKKQMKLERYIRIGSAWKKSERTVQNVTAIQAPSIEILASSQKWVAFTCCRSSKTGVLATSVAGDSTFIPIVEPVYGMSFSPEGNQLIIQCSESLNSSKNKTYVVRLNSKNKQVLSYPYWFAAAATNRTVFADKTGRPVSMTNQGESYQFKEAASLAALLAVRLSPKVKPQGTIRLRKDELPARGISNSCEYVVSSDFKTMLEMCNHYIGTPTGETTDLSELNDKCVDVIYKAGIGTVWNITRPASWPYLGKNIDRDHFLFMIQTPISMGNKKQKAFGPGIYDTNLGSGAVKRVPLPSQLSMKTRFSRRWNLSSAY